jgi:hypothetical protein
MPGLSECFLQANELENSVFVLLSQLMPPYFSCFYSMKWNEYQEYFLGGKGGRCGGRTTLPPSCADCLEIWEPQPPETLRACLGL